MIGNTSAGSSFVFSDTTMTAYALSVVLAKVGGGCNVVLENVTVTDEGVGMMIDADSECGGTQFRLKGVTLPKQVLDLIYSKVKNGSTITAENISATFTQPAEEKAEVKETADIPEKQADTSEEAPKAEKPKTEPKNEATAEKAAPKKESSGYYFTDMLKSTFENAAEGFNTFSAMMRRAEKDIDRAVDESFGDKTDDNGGAGHDDNSDDE